MEHVRNTQKNGSRSTKTCVVIDNATPAKNLDHLQIKSAPHYYFFMAIVKTTTGIKKHNKKKHQEERLKIKPRINMKHLSV